MNTNKYKILVVEDESNIRNFVVALLESAGYQVVTAEKYSMANLMFSSHMPDLIILDLGLPDADGSLLIEVGAEANSIDEAEYTGTLLANVLYEVLK